MKTKMYEKEVCEKENLLISVNPYLRSHIVSVIYHGFT